MDLVAMGTRVLIPALMFLALIYAGSVHLRDVRKRLWHPEIHLPYCRFAHCGLSYHQCHVVTVDQYGRVTTTGTGNNLGIYADGRARYSTLLKAIDQHRCGNERIYLYGDYRKQQP